MAQEKRTITTKRKKTNNQNKIVPVSKTTKKTNSNKKNTSTTIKKEETKTNKIEKNQKVNNDELDIVKVDISSERKDEYYDILEHEKSHFFLKFLITILILGLGLFIIYKFVIRDQKAIFTSGINTIYEKLANDMVKISNIDLLKDNIEIDGVLSINTTNKNNNDLNNYLYDVNIGINRADNKYKLSTSLNENEKKLTSLNYYAIDGKYYLNLGNNYNKTLLLKNNIIDLNTNYLNYSNINYNKLNNSAKSIKNIINSNIDRNKLTKGEEKINNETYEYVELKLTSEEYSNIVSNIIETIKSNNNLVEMLAQSFNTNKEIVLNQLEELQKYNLKNNFNDINIKFYTYGFMANIAGLEIKIDDKQVLYYYDYDGKKDNTCDNCIKETYKVLLNYKEYELYIDKNNNIYNCIIKKNNSDFLHLVFNEFNVDTIDINYELYENNTHGNIHLDFYNKDKDKSGNFKYSVIDNKNTTSINFDYRINNNYIINLNNNDYIDVENLSEDDYLTIENNISKNIKNNTIRNSYKDLFEKIYNY